MNQEQMMGSRHSFSLGLVIAVAFGLSACVPVSHHQAPQRPLPVVVSQPAEPAPTPTPPPPIAQEGQVVIGILLPLSGAQAALGQNLLKAAQLAVQDSGSAQVVLLPQDTQSTAQGAAQAATAALNQGAKLLIGPVLSTEVAAVAPLVQARGTPLLALSNNTRLARNQVFMLAPSPANQVTRALTYARTQGVKGIAALIPATPYGDSVADAVADAASQNNLSLVHQGRTQPQEAPTAIAAKTLAALNATSSSIEAIILPESPTRALAIAQALYAAGLPAHVRFIGTAQWLNLQQMPSPQRAALAGSFFAAEDNDNTSFKEHYQAVYQQKPNPLTGLAYEAASIAVLLAKTDGTLDTARLTSASGFKGINGLVRLSPTGQSERGLGIYEITPSALILRDKAPTRF